MQQTTLKKAIECSGIGLHSGSKVRLSLRPGPDDTGVVFYVETESGPVKIDLAPERVAATTLATTLRSADGTAVVATVEHLMAAIRGLGVDNIRVYAEGGELPIMDGSAASFVFLIRSAGLRRQQAPKRYYALKKPVRFEHEGKSIEAEPYDGFAVDYTIDFDHPFIGRQHYSLDLTPESFIRRIAKARTFGFLKEVEMLQRNGLARGGSLDNAVVLDEYAVINHEGVRFKDEFVRHKILDFIGDAAVLQLPLQGRFTVHCSGHAMNNAFMCMLWANKDVYLEEATSQAPSRVRETVASPAAAMQPAHA